MALIKRDRENFWMLNWLDEYMTGHKGFICGGCFKNIFNKEKVKDLDIFFENKSDFDDAVQYFDSQTPGYDGDDVRDEKYHFHYENDNVKAYKHIETGVVIELCCKIFGKPEEILNKFDFTITKFAYYKEEVEDEKKSATRQKTKNCFCGIFIKEAAMETYRVVSITDRKGNPRIEGRYPLRVGRMCKKPTPRNGDAMMIEWLAQPDGTPYVGMIVTSTVIGFKTEDRGKYIEVTTRNSIYTFERV